MLIRLCTYTLMHLSAKEATNRLHNQYGEVGVKMAVRVVKELSKEDIEERVREVRQQQGEWSLHKRSYVEIWRKEYVYRGIPYPISCIKHVITRHNRIGMHLALEHTDEFQKVHKLIAEKFGKEWLWDDTLHAGQEDWTLEEMERWLHQRAGEDIDFYYKIRAEIA